MNTTAKQDQGAKNAMNNEEEESLSYFINKSSNILVVTYNGKLDARGEVVFATCLSEVLGHEPKAVVMNFQGVTDIENGQFFTFVKAQSSIRDSRCELALCELDPDLKAKLMKNGVVRSYEIFDNLVNALQSSMKAIRNR